MDMEVPEVMEALVGTSALTIPARAEVASMLGAMGPKRTRTDIQGSSLCLECRLEYFLIKPAPQLPGHRLVPGKKLGPARRVRAPALTRPGAWNR